MIRLIAILLALMIVGCASEPTKFHEVKKAKYPPIADFHQVKSKDKMLVFFHPHCKYCHKFIEEIVPEYQNTEQSNKLPLVRMDVSKKSTLYFIEKAYYDKRLQWVDMWPIFVAWHGDETSGYQYYRFDGYTEEEIFYEHIDTIIDLFID